MSKTHLNTLPALAEKNGWTVSGSWVDPFSEHRVTMWKDGVKIIALFDKHEKLVAAARTDELDRKWRVTSIIRAREWVSPPKEEEVVEL